MAEVGTVSNDHSYGLGMTRKCLKVAMVVPAPAPYRQPVYELVAADPDIDLYVIFCSGREPDREWDVATGGFRQIVLKERILSFRGRFIHFNFDVWSPLRSFKPDVVVISGFNPTHLLSYAYARSSGASHIVMIDGTSQSDARITPIHRWVRRRVYAGTQACIGSSEGTLDLFRAYGFTPDKIFKSHLCANNASFFDAPAVEKKIDFIFSGRMVALKNPIFALQVAQGVARRLGRRVSITFTGSGELEPRIRAAAAAADAEVEAFFPGFALQGELPGRYGAARIFLFPTQWEPWGVVANEACAAGVPVLISDVAGAARDLVRNGENGFVLPLIVDQWVDAAVRILGDDAIYARMALRCREIVGEYSYENAAKGIVEAVHAAVCANPQLSREIPAR
jgi:glycosyltransferase involved in cell wall biosynthesis